MRQRPRVPRWVLIVSLLLLASVIAGGLYAFLSRPGPQAPSAKAPSTGQDQLRLNNCPQPPKNLDLTKLSTADLARYGLPSRPTELFDLARWAAVLGRLRHHSCSVRLPPLNGKVHSQQTTKLDLGSTWAGAIASSNTYQQAQAEWSIPCLKTATRDAASSAWVGLGNSGALVQAGIDSDVDPQGRPSYQAWAETYVPPTNGAPYKDYQVLLDFSLGMHCNDQVFVAIVSDARQAGDANAPNTYFVGNLSTGEYQNYNPAHWPVSDGLTAEWILEQPSFISGDQISHKPVSDFGTLQFQGCSANSQEHGLQILSALPHSLTSIDNGSQTLVEPRISSPLTVDVVWKQAS